MLDVVFFKIDLLDKSFLQVFNENRLLLAEEMRAYVQVWLDFTMADWRRWWAYFKGKLDFTVQVSVIKVKVTDD